MTRPGPEIGSFALVDFGSRLTAGGMTNDSFASVLAPLSGNPNIRETLEGKSIFLERVAKEQGENKGCAGQSGIETSPWLRTEGK